MSSLGWSGRLSWPGRLGSMTFTTKTFTTECVKKNMGIPVHGVNRTFTMCPVGHSPHKIFNEYYSSHQTPTTQYVVVKVWYSGCLVW